MTDTYDYIIIGGGTCGPVIARRLSDETSLKILLLEAGSHSKDMDNVHMPGAWTKNHYGPTDWNIETPGQPGLKGRQCKLPRGRFLGGSSGSNGTICVRGVKDDYNDWGFDEWNGDEMFRAMKKAETFHPKKWFPHEEKAHGYDGPLHIEPAPPPFPLAERMFESFQSKGMPYDADMFSHGNTVQGCGHAMRTTWQGYRATAADYVTKDQERPNVEIRCDVTVDKIVMEKGADGLLEAKGAEYVDASGNRITVNASREVILTAGTYCSPAVLMRSGIGPKAELEGLDIPVQLDLPGVGENLQDHQLMWTYYEVSDPTLTDDARMNHDPDAYNTAHKEWTENKSGFMAVFPFGAFGFARLSERLDKEDSPAGEEWRSFPRLEGRDPMDLTKNQPNLEFFNTVGYGGPPEYTDFPKEGQYAFGMCCFLCGLKGRGKVTIKSKDPFAPPFVNPRYLEDRRDLLMMTEGVRFANEIVMQGAGTKNVVKGAWPPGAKHHLNKTNEDWQDFVRDRCSTSYHPGGTAKLGKRDDPNAVVNEHLIVYGTKNLRVADCSIMPTLNSGHTQMPAYGIAEKAAEYILQAMRSSSGAQGAKLSQVDSKIAA